MTNQKKPGKEDMHLTMIESRHVLIYRN